MKARDKRDRRDRRDKSADGLQNERIYSVPMKAFVGTLLLAGCGQRNMQSLSEALHGTDGGYLLQTYRDFESGDDDVLYDMHGDDTGMTKIQISFLAADRIKQLERFDILVVMAAGQDMENYEMIGEEMFEHHLCRVTIADTANFREHIIRSSVGTPEQFGGKIEVHPLGFPAYRSVRGCF